MNRAYSLLTVKSVDEDKRILTGIATTATPDLVEDVVEPKGAEFKLPIPLLWQHDSRQPIGHVTRARVTKDGIEVTAQLVKIDEPGALKDRLDEAWQSIKSGLVRGFSIGFKGLETSRIEGSRGVRFIKWLWLELSAVTLPMNTEATITAVKSLDTDLRAALGHNRRDGVVRLNPPGASGNPNPTKSGREAKTVSKTVQEQITQWEATRAAKAARMTEIMNKSTESGETLDAAQSQEYDALKTELKGIDEHLGRLGDMAALMKEKAKPVVGTDPEGAGLSRDPAARIQVLDKPLEKGMGFIRYVLCMAQAKGNLELAARIAKGRYPEYAPLHRVFKGLAEVGGADLGVLRKASDNMEFLHKTAVAGGTTSDSNWATALVEYTILANEFIEYLRPQTIIGKFGTNGIPSLNRVPFNVKVPRQTTKGTGYWVGEGKPKPLTKFNTDQVTLDFHKVATIAAITKELARFSTPSAERLVRDELAKAVIERADVDFIDPNKAVSSGVSPASVTNGVTAITSATTTGTVAEVIADVQSILSEFIQENIGVQSLAWIMNSNVALALGLMQTSLGNQAFPGITMNGGTFQQIPAVVSQYVPAQLLILVSAEDIYLADDGNVSIDVSEEASLEMLDSSLQQDGTAGTGASLVSMFQTNMIAIRAEREITWLKRRTGAAQYMTGFNPGGTAGSGDI